jgi:hypothetical protein
MKEPEFVEDVDLVMAAVAIRLALVRSCHASPPKRTEIEKLRRSVLKIYDEQIDGLSPKPDYKKGRRSVIDRTFRDFLKVLDERP